MILDPLARRRAVLACCAMLLLLAPGCTLFDDYLPGSPFTPRQPEGQVTVVGSILSDRITKDSPGCGVGGTIFWGTAKNTGDVDVSDVSISISAFDGAGGFLGAFSGNVFSGEIVEDPDAPPSFGTNLVVDAVGSFNVCTPIPFGSVARTEHSMRFVVIDESTDS